MNACYKSTKLQILVVFFLWPSVSQLTSNVTDTRILYDDIFFNKELFICNILLRIQLSLQKLKIVKFITVEFDCELDHMILQK